MSDDDAMSIISDGDLEQILSRESPTTWNISPRRSTKRTSSRPPSVIRRAMKTTGNRSVSARASMRPNMHPRRSQMPESMSAGGWKRKRSKLVTRTIKVQMPRAEYLQKYGPPGAKVTLGRQQGLNRAAPLIDLPEMGGGGDYYSRKTRKKRKGRGKRRRRMNRWGAYDDGGGIYQGQGGFWGDAWNAVKTPLMNVAQDGMKLIPHYGNNIANAFGTARRLGGWGSYADSKRNVLINGGSSTGWQPPMFASPSDTGVMRISHKDIIGTVYAPADTGFHTQTYDINPGLEATFPWLAQLAANFEEYVLVQCIFSFQSLVSDFQTSTGVTGQIIGAPQYDPHKPDFESYQEMLAAHGSQSCMANQHLEIGIECDPRKLAGAPGKFIRCTGLDKDRDVKDFDHGKFVMGFNQFPEKLQNQSIGLLHVSYTVTIRRPNITSGRGLAISRDEFTQAVNESTLPDTTTPLYTGITLCNVVNTTVSTNYQDPEFISKCFDPTLIGMQYQNSKNSIRCRLEEADQILGKFEKFVGPYLPDGVTRLQLVSMAQWNAAATLAFLGCPLSTTTASNNPAPPPDTYGWFQGIKITIPARYSGSLRVLFKLTLTHAVADPGICVNHTGNIKPINDMVVGYHANNVPAPIATNEPTGSMPSRGRNTATCVTVARSKVTIAPNPNSGIQGADTIPGHFGCIEMELHIEVDEATGGVNNSVSIYPLTNNIGSFTTTNIVNSSLVVDEYNAGYVDRKERSNNRK